MRRIVLEFFEIDAIPGDLDEHLAIGRTEQDTPRPMGSDSAVARPPDHAHVVAENTAAELRRRKPSDCVIFKIYCSISSARKRAVGRTMVGSASR